MHEMLHSELLVRSLLKSELLVDEIGGFRQFDRSCLNDVCGSDLDKVFSFRQKLGHLYEDVLTWVFQSADATELLDASIQVYRDLENGGRETIGEFDFLLNISEEFHHVELATKFYLGLEKDGKILWPGPDARDHWGKKRERLVNHQLGIGRCDEARKVLFEHYGVENYRTTHLIYGCLFHHADSTPSFVEGISSSAPWGVWLRKQEWDRVIGERDVWFQPKHLWPCSPDSELTNALERSSKAEMIERSEERCSMFTDGKLRYFLVGQRWLDGVGI